MILGLGALMALPAMASGDQDRFAIRGAGLLNCANFVEEKQAESPAYLMIGGWIDGYITGLNQYAEDTYDITSYESTELIARLIANHCESNPDDRLFTVVNSLMKRIQDDRIRDPEVPVVVEVGERRTYIYPPTLRRIQRALRERDYYEGPIDGSFGPAVAAGMKKFQEEIGFDPSGYPDQASIWFLLNDFAQPESEGEQEG